MITIEFLKEINAPRQKVWEALWNDVNYRKWTSVFGEGSRAISDWKEGSEVQFVGDNGDGMFGTIEKKIDNETIVFRHEGEIKDGQKTVTEWAGAKEVYVLNETGDTTELKVSLDTTEAMKEYFEKTFPKGLEIVKQIAEQKN